MAFDNRNIEDEMSESFLNEFKERMTIDPLSDSVRHTSKQTSRKQGIIIAILIVLAVTVGLFWNLYSSYINDSSSITEIPILTADNSPIKERPLDEGGMNIPDQDKNVYTRIESIPLTDSETATPLAPVSQASSETLPSTQYQKMLPTTEKPVPPPAALIQPAEPEKQAVVPSTPPTTQQSAPVVAASPKTTAKATPTPSISPVVAKTSTPPPPPAATAAATTTTDSFRIQLVSLQDKDGALKAYATALKKNPNLAKYQYEIVEAYIEGKGTFYRLQLKPFATRDAAQKLCNELKTLKQDCIVVPTK